MMFWIGSAMSAGMAGILRCTSISRVRSARVLMPSYGSGPPKISLKMQPADQMSTFSVIFDLLSKSSGAMYRGDPPLFFLVMWVRSMDSVRPKSQSLRLRFRSKTTLRDLRSRCTTTGFWQCKYITPSASCKHMLVPCSGGRRSFRTCNRWCKDPPGQYSVTKQRYGISRHAPTKLTSLLWRKCLKDSISLVRSWMMTSGSTELSQYSCLMATSVPWKKPRKTWPNSPEPRLSTNWSSR
mmetsp:Transcript_108005/g.344339  ORF Transcript_108005/g.344339 Transcript_108005/m.344339 type:complete len:239 (-) Transcript_108005:218-934(-)